MDPRIEKLINTFQDRGWRMKGAADISSDWWFQDILELVSVWSPVGTYLYMTLLTDPQIADRKVVWCVSFSSTIPDNRNFTFIDGISLNDIKKENLLLLVEKVNNVVLNHGI
jgi:hypothetical protein